MYNIKILTAYSSDAAISFLKKYTDSCGRFELPQNGVYGRAGEIRITEWYNTIPNASCRQHQYVISKFRDEYCILPLYKAKEEDCVKVNLGGDPERWGRTYKLTVSELNKALNERIDIRTCDVDCITSKLEKVLFKHLQIM